MTDDSPASRGRANPSTSYPSESHGPDGEAGDASEAHVQVRIRLGELELGYSGVRSYYESRVDDWTHQVLQRIRAGLLTPDTAPPAGEAEAEDGAASNRTTAPMRTVGPSAAVAEGSAAGLAKPARGSEDTSGERNTPGEPRADDADERSTPARAETRSAESTGILTFDDEDDEFVPIEDDEADRATFDPTGSPRFAPFLRQVGDRARRPDQQVMAFAFFLWNHERMPSFAPADLEACFKGIGIASPDDLRGIVDDLVDRQRFLAPDEETGGLQLTPKGVNYAKNRLVRPV